MSLVERRVPSRVMAGLAAMLVLGVVSGCSDDPSGRRVPADASKFDLMSFFAGDSYSKGTVTTAFFFDESFTATFKGAAGDGHLTLDERFTFEDGKRLQRWNLAAKPSGAYSGTVTTELKSGRPAPAAPVEGYATANGAVLDYQGYAPGGGETLLHFRHVLTMQDDGTVANHVTVSKYRVPLATSDVTFAKSLAALTNH